MPYAAKLTSDSGVELLLTERDPDPRLSYLVAALASPKEFDDSYDDPHAPPSVVLPAQPDLAAEAITDTFLSVYRRALHDRRLDAVVAALDELHEAYAAVAAIWASGPADAGTPVTDPGRVALNRSFANNAWRIFRDVLAHAPGLLRQCAAAVADGSADADTVAQLGKAVASSQAALDAWRRSQNPASAQPSLRLPPLEIRVRLGLEAVPAIETWLASRDAFLRIARAAEPVGPAQALSGTSPAPPALPAVRRPPKPPAPRR